MELNVENYFLKPFVASGLPALVIMALDMGLIYLVQIRHAASYASYTNPSRHLLRPVCIILRGVRGRSIM
jgi:hypothetical protein